MLHLTVGQWLLACPRRVWYRLREKRLCRRGMLHVLVFAYLFGARASTGIVLPMLIVGDILAVIAFRQHARWDYIRRLLPPAALGVLLGWLLMQRIADSAFKPIIGGAILFLSILQLARLWKPTIFEQVPHRLWFAWAMGLLAGVTTMLANAAGPIMALFLLAVALPKLELVGTGAWFFLSGQLLQSPFQRLLSASSMPTVSPSTPPSCPPSPWG